MLYCEKDESFSTEEVLHILQQPDWSKVITVPPIRPRAGHVFLYHITDKHKKHDWKCDQYNFHHDGTRKQPKRNPQFKKLFFVIKTREGKDNRFKKHAFVLLKGNQNLVLFQYIGDESIAEGVPHGNSKDSSRVYTRVCPSITSSLKHLSLCIKQEEEPESETSFVLRPRSLAHIRNIQYRHRRKTRRKEVSTDDDDNDDKWEDDDDDKDAEHEDNNNSDDSDDDGDDGDGCDDSVDDDSCDDSVDGDDDDDSVDGDGEGDSCDDGDGSAVSDVAKISEEKDPGRHQANILFPENRTEETETGHQEKSENDEQSEVKGHTASLTPSRLAEFADICLTLTPDHTLNTPRPIHSVTDEPEIDSPLNTPQNVTDVSCLSVEDQHPTEPHDTSCYTTSILQEQQVSSSSHTHRHECKPTEERCSGASATENRQLNEDVWQVPDSPSEFLNNCSGNSTSSVQILPSPLEDFLQQVQVHSVTSALIERTMNWQQNCLDSGTDRLSVPKTASSLIAQVRQCWEADFTNVLSYLPSLKSVYQTLAGTLVPDLMFDLTAALIVGAYRTRSNLSAFLETLNIRPNHLANTGEGPCCVDEGKEYRFGNYLVTGRNLQRLQGDGWLDDSVIHSYLHLLRAKCAQSGIKVFILECFLAKLWERGSFHEWLYQKEMLSRYDWILMPICRNHHWILLSANVQDRTISVINSKPSAQMQREIVNHWSQFMQCRSEHTEEQLCDWEQKPCPTFPQTDDSSCGIFVLMAAEAVLSGVPPAVMRNCHVAEYRKYIQQRLLTEQVEELPTSNQTLQVEELPTSNQTLQVEELPTSNQTLQVEELPTSNQTLQVEEQISYMDTQVKEQISYMDTQVVVEKTDTSLKFDEVTSNSGDEDEDEVMELDESSAGCDAGRETLCELKCAPMEAWKCPWMAQKFP